MIAKPVRMFAVLASVAVAAAVAQNQPRSWTDPIPQKLKELIVIKQRAQNLANEADARHLEPKQLAREQNWRGAWDKVFEDLDSWAQKYNSPTQNKSLPTSAPDASGHPLPKHYPLVADGPPGVADYLCLKDFSRSSEATFVYHCAKE